MMKSSVKHDRNPCHVLDMQFFCIELDLTSVWSYISGYIFCVRTACASYRQRVFETRMCLLVYLLLNHLI